MAGYNFTTIEELLRAVASLGLDDGDEDLYTLMDKDFCKIQLALLHELPLTVIKDIIHNGNPDEGFSKDQQWAFVMTLCLFLDRLDVFEMLLDEGVRPDLIIPGQLIINKYDTPLLHSAVGTGNYAAVQLLLRKNANVNKVLEHPHRPDVYSPKHCRSIMCTVFSNDDPGMMKLLLERYDQSCNWDGKCTLSMACHKGAEKCALSLLKKTEYKEHVNLSDVRLHHIPFNKTTLLPILYDMGVKKGIYTPNDLGECLWYADANCLDSPIQEPFIADDVELLLGLGAPVNFEVDGHTPLDLLLQPIILTKHDVQRPLFRTLPKAVSLLFHHGARAQFKFVNAFLFSVFVHVILIHRKKHPVLLEEVLDFFFKMISLLWKDEFSKQIVGSQSPSPSPIEERFEWFLGQPCYKTLCESIICRSDCSSLLGATKVCVLDLDITEPIFKHSLSNIFCVPRPVSCTDRCDCQSLFAWTLMSISPHKKHQTYIQMLHDSASKDQCAKICQHFPFDRSLKDLARVSVLSTLHLPRSVSAKKLPIPRSLQEYLCLQ